jgi:GNAT superfamily N-acetyltransferase
VERSLNTPTGLTYRRAAAADADAAARIITVALKDLAAKQGRPPVEAPDDLAAPALRHLLETDAERLWAAVADGRPVAIGAAWERDALSYCGGLFVLPEWQGHGVGKRLFELAMEGLPAAGGVAALTSSAANPVSNALYARHGIYPLLALMYLSGPVGAVPPPGRVGLEAEPLTSARRDELRDIDLAVLGADRAVDHSWFLETMHNPGWLFRRRGTEGAGALGPVATLRSQDQLPVLCYALADLAARGVTEATVAVPGPNIAAQRLLWEAGFSFPAATGLLCASRPFGRFDRYLLAGDCLM